MAYVVSLDTPDQVRNSVAVAGATPVASLVSGAVLGGVYDVLADHRTFEV